MAKKKIFNRSWSLVDVGHAQSAARRINDRLVQIEKNLGVTSPQYQDIISKIDMFFPGNYRYKNGVVQIIKPSQLGKDPVKLERLLNLEKETPTWGQTRKEYEKKFEDWKAEDPFGGKGLTIQEFINVELNLPNALASMYTLLPEQYATQALNIMQVRGRRKTYNELSTVIRNVQKGLRKGNLFDMKVSYHGV